MISDDRKLKRGLKDISPLFNTPLPPAPKETFSPAPALARPSGIHCLSILGPGTREEISFLNQEFASKLSGFQQPCSLVTIFPRCLKETQGPAAGMRNFNPAIRKFRIRGDDFEQICSASPRNAPAASGQILLLDFESSSGLYFDKIIPVLDKVILLLKPDFESLSESYKWMKASIPLHPQLEYFLLSEERLAGSAGVVYEKFCGLVARRLQVSINWLGSYRNGDALSLRNLALDQLFLKQSDTPEKRALSGFIQGL